MFWTPQSLLLGNPVTGRTGWTSRYTQSCIDWNHQVMCGQLHGGGMNRFQVFDPDSMSCD